MLLVVVKGGVAQPVKEGDVERKREDEEKWRDKDDGPADTVPVLGVTVTNKLRGGGYNN